MKRIVALLLLTAVLSGCAGKTPAVRIPEEDRRLTVYTCLEEAVYAPLVLEFEDRTGVWVQVQTGTATELLERCRNGGCDLLLGCEADLLAAYEENFLPLPETGVPLTALCPQSDTIVSVWLRSMVLVYNSRLIRQNPPTGFGSLLDPAWRGQIAFADPETSDFSRTALAILRQQLGDEGVSRFSGNLGTLLPDVRAVIDGVAEGSFRLALVPEDAALRAITEGKPLALAVPEEGAYRIALATAIPAGAPHGDTAASFLAFLRGEDAQRYAMENSALDPVLESLARSVENETALDPGQAGREQSALMALWRECREGAE